MGQLLIVPLHGAIGMWDEILALAIPATIVMGIGIAIASLRGSKENDSPDDLIKAEAGVGDEKDCE